MTLVVEDGTGLETSNGYISVAYADSYFTDRGNDAWLDLDEEVKEASIVKATDYLDFRFNYKGQISSETQALEWPRDYVYDSLGNLIDGLPSKLQKACAEYAYRASLADLAPDPTYDDTGGKVIEFRNKVDVIEESKKFDSASSTITIRAYPAADRLLKDLVDNYGSGSLTRV